MGHGGWKLTELVEMQGEGWEAGREAVARLRNLLYFTLRSLDFILRMAITTEEFCSREWNPRLASSVDDSLQWEMPLRGEMGQEEKGVMQIESRKSIPNTVQELNK